MYEKAAIGRSCSVRSHRHFSGLVVRHERHASRRYFARLIARITIRILNQRDKASLATPCDERKQTKDQQNGHKQFVNVDSVNPTVGMVVEL